MSIDRVLEKWRSNTQKSYSGIWRDLKYGIIGDKDYINEDLNVLNFERIKWGGIRHGQLIYTLLDLQQLQIVEIPKRSTEDGEIFKNILW